VNRTVTGLAAPEHEAVRSEDTDPSTAEITAAAAGGGAFDFWADEGEDLYLPSDGKSLG
jgi:hypothetical protein